MPITTDSRHAHAVAPNLLDWNFEVDAPNTVWLAAISYIPTDEGWLYLAAVKDLAAHGADELEVVAHALNTRPRKTLGWKTPAEALDEILRPVQKDHVATTG